MARSIPRADQSRGNGRPNDHRGWPDVSAEIEGSFFDLMLPAKAASEWKKSWFYVTEATLNGEVAIPRYSADRPEPRRLQVGKLPTEQQMVVDEMLQTIHGLKKRGLQPINLYNCWLGR